ncbi:YceI family protein [Amaricoccus macauensis]|uniref:YceI family protein n=1 Tax=Amaricoccus macauensis TaxID=57001 RepID=UPI003C7A6A4A
MRWCSLFLALFLPATALAEQWQIDPETRVSVDVAWRNTVVTVDFPAISGEVIFDERHPERARAVIHVATGSASTGLGPVDALVRSRDYLAAARHPTITFHLETLKPISRSAAEISGRITMRGHTRPAEFDARVIRYGPAADNPDRFVAGFDVTGEIDRTAFGSTGGLPDVPAMLPVRVRLVMSSRGPA